MIKKIMLWFLIVLFLSGCNTNDFTKWKGEGQNWKGEYSANIGSTSEEGKYLFTLKQNDETIFFEQLKIDINDGELILDDSNHEGSIIEIPSSCRNCHTSKEESIKVTIHWNKQEVETFYLRLDE